MNTFTSKISKEEIFILEKEFEAGGALFLKPQYTYYQVRIDNVTATFYLSGKVVVQGANVDDFVSKYLKKDEQMFLFQKEDVLADIEYPHIGVDESGKGDFFGPLIIAGAMLDKENAKKLEEIGVCDSKKISDKKIIELAKKIKEIAIFDVVTISPKKYNELYLKFKNLNKLLAWGHATVIENILKKNRCNLAISDKFGDEKFILSALKENGKKIKLIQETKAERDIAVAAASVLARYEFIKNISNLSEKYEMNFPKGASLEVIKTGKLFLEKYGTCEIKNVSKAHFKTFSDIVN